MKPNQTRTLADFLSFEVVSTERPDAKSEAGSYIPPVAASSNHALIGHEFEAHVSQINEKIDDLVKKLSEKEADKRLLGVGTGLGSAARL